MNSESHSPNLPRRKVLQHDTPPWVGSNAIFFITVNCATRGENQLCHEPLARAIYETIEFRQARGDWFVHLFLIMPDHCHALVSFPRDGNMRKTLSNWKEITAKITSVRWQRDFFDHRLRAEESYEAKAHYIRMNPVRKELVAQPGDWRFVWEPQ